MTRFCPSHTRAHTHTHLFPFPLRQLCQPLISTCVGHKMAKGQLKASLSWLTGSQFVSYKHRTQVYSHILLSPTHISQCALTPDAPRLSYGKVNPTTESSRLCLFLDFWGIFLLRKSSWTLKLVAFVFQRASSQVSLALS